MTVFTRRIRPCVPDLLLKAYHPCPSPPVSHSPHLTQGNCISHVLNRSNHHFGKAMGLKLIRFSNNPLVKQFQYLRLGSYLRKLLSQFLRSSSVKASRRASIYPTERVVLRRLGCDDRRGVSRPRLLITLAPSRPVPKGRVLCFAKGQFLIMGSPSLGV